MNVLIRFCVHLLITTSCTVTNMNYHPRHTLDLEVSGRCYIFYAMCFCRGAIVLENETYIVEPVPQSASNQHLLYLLRDIQSDPVTCGVVDEDASSSHSPKHFDPGQTLTSFLRVRIIAALTQTHIHSVNGF